MNRIIRFIQSYLIIGLPFVIALMVWNSLQPQSEIFALNIASLKILFNILAFNIMLWFSIFLIFLVMLVVIPHAREMTLRRLANLKERDEREEYITGKAARASYISTLSLMILLLFFSLFTLNISKTPAHDKQQVSVGIGLHFDLLSQSKIEKTVENNVIFESKDIPLSKTAIILILICWQLLIFNITARHIEKRN